MKIDANYIRKFVSETYVRPARDRGQTTLAIPVKRVEEDLKKVGLQTGRTPLVCSAIRGNKFQDENEILLDRWDGPPSGQSTTVVFHFHLAEKARAQAADPAGMESPEDRAYRLTEKLRGLLKDEMAEYGGGEAFLRWVRSEDDDEGAA
jgi:hypothetical protein